MIVVSPTDAWVRNAFGACQKTLRIASPFIGKYLVDRVNELTPGVKTTLLTRTRLSDFATRSSDLEAVCSIAAKHSSVLSLNSLHAKVYIIDEREALVTSANATFSGMYRNAECGYTVTTSAEITQIIALFKSGFGSQQTIKPWTLPELRSLHQPVEFLRRSMPKMASSPSVEDQSKRLLINRPVFRKLVEEFSGWLRLTLEAVLIIEKPVFTLDDVWTAAAPIIVKQFPDNHFPRPKIRQQLQRLRDLGLLDFLGGATYELLVRPKE